MTVNEHTQFYYNTVSWMLSCPGKSTWPVIISARIQAADQTSTERERDRERILIIKMEYFVVAF